MTTKQWTQKEILESDIARVVGEYVGAEMGESPKWTYNADKAEILVRKILSVIDGYCKGE